MTNEKSYTSIIQVTVYGLSVDHIIHEQFELLKLLLLYKFRFQTLGKRVDEAVQGAVPLIQNIQALFVFSRSKKMMKQSPIKKVRMISYL